MLIIVSLAAGYTAFTHGGFRSDHRAFAAPVAGLSMPSANTSAPAAAASRDTVLRAPAVNTTFRVEQPATVREKEEAQQFTALGATPTPAATAAVAEDALLRAEAVAPAPPLPLYQIIRVQDGDTVSSIATKYGVSVDYILANNAEIRDSDILSLGQSILVPAGNGILHEVRYGETLSDIADRYGVSIDDITRFEPNHIATADDITETQLLYVPSAHIPPPPAAVAEPVAEPAPLAGSAPASSDSGGTGGPGPAASAPVGGDEAPVESSGAGLVWPVVGPISSYYGPSHPLGIDIDGFNLAGSPVHAATSGTVVFAGGNACCSYGLYVVVLSADGIETLYAHLSSISVSAGESVSQGEAVGIIGSTGYSTGTHLHFEVIDNGTRVNPLDYLP